MANSKQDEAEIWLKVVCMCNPIICYLCNSGILSVHYRLLTMTHQSKTEILDWYVMCYLENGNKKKCLNNDFYHIYKYTQVHNTKTIYLFELAPISKTLSNIIVYFSG